ncbi:hypothetical protein I4U23_016516 [Adineta vaga]|nr:hypothetical protein I4U23_016516 [Adineta vaga]
MSKILPISDNHTNSHIVGSINNDTFQTTITQSRTSCECFRRRKLMWMIFGIIAVILSASIISVIFTVGMKKQTNEATTSIVTTELSEIVAITTETWSQSPPPPAITKTTTTTTKTEGILF